MSRGYPALGGRKRSQAPRSNAVRPAEARAISGWAGILIKAGPRYPRDETWSDSSRVWSRGNGRGVTAKSDTAIEYRGRVS